MMTPFTVLMVMRMAMELKTKAFRTSERHNQKANPQGKNPVDPVPLSGNEHDKPSENHNTTRGDV